MLEAISARVHTPQIIANTATAVSHIADSVGQSASNLGRNISNQFNSLSASITHIDARRFAPVAAAAAAVVLAAVVYRSGALTTLVSGLRTFAGNPQALGLAALALTAGVAGCMAPMGSPGVIVYPATPSEHPTTRNSCAPVFTDTIMADVATRDNNNIRLSVRTENPNVEGLLLYRYDMSCAELNRINSARSGNQCYPNATRTFYNFSEAARSEFRRNHFVTLIDTHSMSPLVSGACYTFMPFQGDCASTPPTTTEVPPTTPCPRVEDRSVFSRSVSIR